MNAAILNREFQHPSDGWYQIEPKGEHWNAGAELLQVIDDTAAAAIVNRFNQDASTPNFAGMLIDHEHFKHDSGKETLAYGWLMELQNRNDGIYGKVRWTNTGRTAVDGGDYRFFSTEYQPREVVILNHAARKRGRPMRLDGLTLTNDPNNKGGRPITNKEFRPGTGAEADRTETKPKYMKQVAVRLGLSAEASEESVLEAANKIMNRAEAAEKALEPLKNRNTELETTNKELMGAQIESDLERYKNRFKPEAREKVKANLLLNRKQAIEMLELMPEVTGTTGVRQTPIHNRATAKTPETKLEDGDVAAARVREANGLIEDYRLANRCSYDAARNVIRNRKPELFGPTA